MTVILREQVAGQVATDHVVNTNPRGIRLPTGTIKLVIGVGSTTGTWRHYIRWEPLEQDAYITPAF